MNGLYALLSALILGLALYGFVMTMDHAFGRISAWLASRPKVTIAHEFGRGISREALCARRERECAVQVESLLHAEAACAAIRRAGVNA